MNYRDLNDFELLNYVAEGNEYAHDIVIEKYKPVINKFAIKMINACHNTGLEISDLEQEGLVGLMHAIETFSDQKDTAFYTYAKTCIERSIISAVISSKRLKHKILNESLSFDSEELNNEKLLKDDLNNPENIIVDLDTEDYIINKMKTVLTDLEDQVFQLMIAGFNYKEIAELLDKEPKSIDNTIQRIKKKVKDVIEK